MEHRLFRTAVPPLLTTLGVRHVVALSSTLAADSAVRDVVPVRLKLATRMRLWLPTRTPLGPTLWRMMFMWRVVVSLLSALETMCSTLCMSNAFRRPTLRCRPMLRMHLTIRQLSLPNLLALHIRMTRGPVTAVVDPVLWRNCLMNRLWRVFRVSRTRTTPTVMWCLSSALLVLHMAVTLFLVTPCTMWHCFLTTCFRGLRDAVVILSTAALQGLPRRKMVPLTYMPVKISCPDDWDEFYVRSGECVSASWREL